MKRITVLIVSLIMVFAFTACGGGGDGGDTEKSKDDGYKVEKLLNFSAKTGVHMVYETEYEGQTVKSETHMKGDKIYTMTYIDGTPGSITILNGDYMYVLSPSSKTGVKAAAPDGVDTMIDNAGGIQEEFKKYMDDIEVGETEVDGKTYYSETFTITEDGSTLTATYCFDGDDLVYMIGDVDGEKQTVKYLAYDEDVDDSLFDVPSDYTITEQ